MGVIFHWWSIDYVSFIIIEKKPEKNPRNPPNISHEKEKKREKFERIIAGR